MMSATGGIALIVVGAILAFAVRTGDVFGVNLQIVGAILIIAGVAGLLLARTGRSPSLRLGGGDQDGAGPSGTGRDDDMREAAAEDVAAVRGDDHYFRPDDPGNHHDTL
jgi:hypothetical protein